MLRTILCSFLIISSLAHASENKKTTIGIIVPMQHAALTDMVTGFKDELTKLGKHDCEIKVMNAQGDLSMQMAILQNLIENKCDIFVPIGTQTSQMTLKTVKKGSIVALAAKLDQDVQQKDVAATTGVLDELSMDDQMRFLQTLFPQMKKMTVVHSGSEKVHQELQEITQIAKKEHIQIQSLMAQNMIDLATVSKNIDPTSDCIFVLKDHLIVSGIHLLVKQANVLKIPVVTSDEGSVKEGAALALGVREKDIGKVGANIVFRITRGENAKEIPIRCINDISIFVNTPACKQQNVDPLSINAASRKHHYNIVTYTKE